MPGLTSLNVVDWVVVTGGVGLLRRLSTSSSNNESSSINVAYTVTSSAADLTYELLSSELQTAVNDGIHPLHNS